MSGLWTQMVSALQGEVPADTLEAYRRASLGVHDLITQGDAVRTQATLEGKTAWTLPKGTQAELLCAWNAFVLQSLGNEFLDADYRDNPPTAGFVPPITADQVLRFYTQVESWLSRAHQAHANPDYQLDVHVPAELPPWSEVEPCPNSHLHGMLHAMRTIRDHATIAMQALGSAPPEDKEQLAQYYQIQQVLAAATTKARYSEDLHGGNPTRDMHERVEPHIKESIEAFYRLGQLIAMPSLALRPMVGWGGPSLSGDETLSMPRLTHDLGPRPDPKLVLPGDPEFDPWCLTDPDMRDIWMSDPAARKAIKKLWELNPDPTKTVRIQSDIDQAFAKGHIRRAIGRNGKRVGYFFCCPWGPIYEVVNPVTIGNKYLRTLQQFVFDVTAEGVNLGAPFTCEIMLGNFQSTNRVEYGDPSEAPDH